MKAILNNGARPVVDQKIGTVLESGADGTSSSNRLLTTLNPTDSRPRPLSIVILGLSITSSWGNGHATTYRSLVRELASRGHKILFLERDAAWYAANRDLRNASFCRIELYSTLKELKDRFTDEIHQADCVVLGSYVPEGASIGEWVTRAAEGVTAFYDIDTPVTLGRLENDTADYVTRKLIPRYDMYLSFTGGPTLKRLETSYGARMARPLYCSVDTTHYFPEQQTPTWDLGYMGTYSSDRQPTVERLLLNPASEWQNGKFVVAGAQFPTEIRWPKNVERVTHLPPARHREFYNSQRFTLNVTRTAMIEAGYSPSVRLFEAAACATPIISDDWDGLDSFFKPGKEILVARSSREALGYLRDLPESERCAIGLRACDRILAAHTAKHRAAELENYIHSLLAPAPANT